MDATTVWYMQMCKLLACQKVNIRGIKCRESISDRVVVDMNEPFVRHSGRKISESFRYAEAYWILSGDNRVLGIERFAPSIAYFSDNGVVFQGAYGPKVTEQLRYVIESIEKDGNTRQAVLNIWRENPRDSKDIPCTLNLQFLLRDSELHCIANMRSSDVWLGLPYDIFNFTCIANYVRLSLMLDEQPNLGSLTINMGSSHLYEMNVARAKAVADGVVPLHITADEPQMITEIPYCHNENEFMQWLVNSRGA